jgi:hypothetical protein
MAYSSLSITSLHKLGRRDFGRQRGTLRTVAVLMGRLDVGQDVMAAAGERDHVIELNGIGQRVTTEVAVVRRGTERPVVGRWAPTIPGLPG